MKKMVCVIGCGQWGKNHVRNFSQLRALGWICDQNPDALAAQATLYPEIRSTTQFEEVLARDDVQAVVIATPAELHFSHARAAILAGKDILIEKPLALHYDEGRELVELAAKKAVILMVGHILEYHPAIRLLHDLLRRGELGRILYIYSNRLNLGKVRQVENIMWSLAPHDIAVICRLVGSTPIAVSSSGGIYLQTGIEDVTVTSMQFDEGVRSHIFVSWLHPFKEQKLVVVGDRKMAVFDDTAREGKLKLYDKGIEQKSGLLVPRQTAETTLFFDETEPLRLECEHFIWCVRKRERPFTDGTSALRVLKVLQASQRSLEQGGAVIDLTEDETQAATARILS